MRWLPLLVAGLALTALIVHLTVPFAQVVTQDDQGAVVRDETLSRSEMEGEREGSVTAPGAGFTYMLVATILMAGGALAFAIGAQTRGSWFQLATASLTGLGATMTLHSQGLWAGKGLTSWIQKTMGWDNPPQAWAPYFEDHSLADLATYVTMVSPFIVVLLTFTLLFVLVRSWVGLVREDRQLRDHARGHGRLAIVGAGLFLVIMLVPWVVTVMQGSVQPEGATPDEDTFFWSAYDVLQIREVSWDAAQESREGGLELWGPLSILMKVLMVTGLLGVIAPLAGIAGKHMESLQQPVFGRLTENVSLITVLLYPFAAIAGLLGSFVLHDPSDLFAAKTTGIALTVTLAAGAASIYAFIVARDVVADETDAVADDFPEPVVYE